MRTRTASVLLAALCALALCGTGCQTTTQTGDQAAVKTRVVAPKTSVVAVETSVVAPPGWKLAYKADFTNAKAADQWVKNNAVVTVEKGSLVVKPEGAEEVQIMLKAAKFPGSVRVEFVGSLTGDTISDLTCMLNGDEYGYSNAYILQFGGRGNSLSRLLVADDPVPGTVNDAAVVTPGKKHRVVATNDGGKITLEVDGKQIFSHVETDPFAGAGHDMIGFYTWDCTLTLDKLVVYTKAAGKPAK
ncbi:hypothetical protein LCGC14_2810440 [marine sediment metagenome]|uniref:3-keto-disaccharide hydrolase domain-containing protein n=1 Tax=marine sediment metagenome TaxID=412755 RepID=A0A0F8YJZ8_9ZZZZ